MALARWKDLCIDASDPEVAAAFWSSVLDLEIQRRSHDVTCLSGEPAERTVWVNRVAEPKTGKNRVHLDLVLPRTDDLEAAGATVLHRPGPGREWHVLADPEGNELCAFLPGPAEPSALVVDAAAEHDLAAWWAEVLGARLTPGPDGVLRWLRDVPGLPFDVWKFVRVPESKSVKNRWHWDLACDDVEALLRRGATLLRRPDAQIDWHVLADPEGNEFCAFPSS